MYALRTFHVEERMTYTYEQVLAYEVARELANTHIADYSAAIWDEKHRQLQTRPVSPSYRPPA